MAENEKLPSDSNPLQDEHYQSAIEEKVREMMDPDSKHHDPHIDEVVTEMVNKVNDEKKPSLGKRLVRGWRAWWHNPTKRRASLIVMFVTLVAVFVIPPSRYFVLNTAGVRSSASMIILDDSTQQPLKNVRVELGHKTGQTDEDGKVVLSKIRLGTQKLIVHKRAFAELSKNVTIGWGSNPLGSLKISPTGSQYSFQVSDYLSGKPLKGVEAISGEFNAQSSEEGLIRLTIDDVSDEASINVEINAKGYRQDIVELNLDSEEVISLELAPEQQHVFISKRSGRYDIYKIDADGKNETKILSGSGAERDDLALIPHPTNGYVALVSTRENVRNQSGFLLSTLTLIEPEQNIPTKIAQSERIQIVDWIKDRLVFVQIKEGASASDPKRHRLMSYDLETGNSTELAAANYFNDVISIGTSIFYAPSSTYSTESAGFYKISADGKSKLTVLAEEVWNVFRTSYDKLVMSATAGWYDYTITSLKVTKLSGEPPNLQGRVYISSPDGTMALWVDDRDGKGVLLSIKPDGSEEQVLVEKSGLQNPVRWLNNSSVVFRVSTSQETADYVMSLDGGEAKKLRDVTNTAGIDRWYYY